MTSWWTRVALVALLGIAGACPSAGGLGSTTGSALRHGTVVSGAGSGGPTSGTSSATSEASSGTTGGASTAGTTGGSTGGACGNAFIEAWFDGGFLPAPGECLSSQVELKGRLTNLCDYTGQFGAPITATFSATDEGDPGIVAQTAPCGVFWFCVDAGTNLTPSFEVTGDMFAPALLATLDMQSVGSPNDDSSPQGVALFCTSVLTAFGLELAPPIVPSLGFVAIELEWLSGACSDPAGWSFTLVAPDGGLVTAPWFYLSGSSVLQDDGGTRDDGIEIFYNVDPGLGFVTVSGDRSGNELADGGLLCPCVSTSPPYAQFSGRVPLQGSVGSLYYYLLP